MISATDVCDLAHVDRDRLNEAIARGDYPCAPATRPGAKRLFNEQDFIALAVYGALTTRGIPPRVAGEIACSSKTAIENAPDTKLLAIIWEGDGRAHGVTPDIEGALAEMKVPTRAEFEAGGAEAMKRAYFSVPSVEILNVAAFRGKFRVALERKKWAESNHLILEEKQTAAAVEAATRALLRGDDAQ